MLLHGVKDMDFEIFHGDTLLNDWDIMREQNPAKKPYFDAIVANPPFSLCWEPERSGDRLHEGQPGGRAQRVKSRRTS